MKKLMLISLLTMAACSSAPKQETVTPIDARPTNFTITFNNNAGGASTYSPAMPSEVAQVSAEPVDDRSNCMLSPIYSPSGRFLHMVKQCFGGQ